MKTKSIPLKLKITFFYVIATMIGVSLCAFQLLNMQKKEIAGIIETRMKNAAEYTSEKVSERLDQMTAVGTALNTGEAQKKLRYYERGVHFILYDAGGDLISEPLPLDVSVSDTIAPDVFRYEEINNGIYYIYDKSVTTKSGDIYIIKGVFPASNELFTFKLTLRYTLYLVLIVILFSAVGGYIILGRMLKPINRITLAAKRIAESGNLKERISIGGRTDEIGDLANTFDEMLSKLDTAMEAEKQFTSDVSHELRTPVTVLLSECEFLKDRAKNSPEYDMSLSMIERQAKKINNLVSGLLCLSRMDRNAIEPQFENTDISELLSFICDEQEKIQKRGIALERKIESNVFADVDRMLISRLFINLISNAYKFSYETGLITITLKTDGKNVLFSVSDTGIGISEEDLSRIWERFYQADKSRTYSENGSSGLGLAMVKWIAQAHGGRVYAASELGAGSTFTFEFPQTNNERNERK